MPVVDLLAKKSKSENWITSKRRVHTSRRHTRLIPMNLGFEFIIAVVSKQTVLYCNLTVSSWNRFSILFILCTYLGLKNNNHLVNSKTMKMIECVSGDRIYRQPPPQRPRRSSDEKNILYTPYKDETHWTGTKSQKQIIIII